MSHSDNPPTVLCVDDEPSVLAGIARNLRVRFRVTTAVSGEEGLRAIAAADEPFEVVMSDMMMPQMNGAEFLRRARDLAPDSVRVLLTGQADAESAAAAVNEGKIARFLTKPCDVDALTTALDECSRVYRQSRIEAELLDKTLRASVRALVDTLALADPVAFARIARVRATVAELLDALHPAGSWWIEIAAMLSQLGSVAVPREVTEKLNDGIFLSADEQRLVDAIPAHSVRLIEHIPRLDVVCAIITGHDRGVTPLAECDTEALGASMIKLAIDLDQIEARGLDRTEALQILGGRGEHRAPLLAMLQANIQERQPTTTEIEVSELRPGMIVVEDVREHNGTLLVGRGYQVNESLVARLRERLERREIPTKIVVSY